jgi:hypothetical protein
MQRAIEVISIKDSCFRRQQRSPLAPMPRLLLLLGRNMSCWRTCVVKGVAVSFSHEWLVSLVGLVECWMPSFECHSSPPPPPRPRPRRYLTGAAAVAPLCSALTYAELGVVATKFASAVQAVHDTPPAPVNPSPAQCAALAALFAPDPLVGALNAGQTRQSPPSAVPNSPYHTRTLYALHPPPRRQHTVRTHSTATLPTRAVGGQDASHVPAAHHAPVLCVLVGPPPPVDIRWCPQELPSRFRCSACCGTWWASPPTPQPFCTPWWRCVQGAV